MSAAMVLLSGGQDSTTCLFWAKTQFTLVEAVTFDYGQKHHIELEASKEIAVIADVQHTILPIDTFKAIGGNALTDKNIQVSDTKNNKNLPNTFVPGRNIIFLTFAAAFAYQKEIHHVVGGMCQIDFAGYPDCRNDTIKSLEQTLTLGMEYGLTVHTPLMFRSKAEIWKMAHDLNCFDIVEKHSHSCYNGVKGGCGECNACVLRQKGLLEYHDKFGK